MKILVSPPRQGKTTRLIRLCAKNGGIIVCHSAKERERVWKILKLMNPNASMPITYAQFLRGEHCIGVVPWGHKVYVDNIDLFIAYVAKVPVGAATLTSEIIVNEFPEAAAEE